MYIPKNRIKENLYTPGNEFVIKTTNKSYTGFYHSLYTGKFYTGKTPNDSNVREIISEVVTGNSKLSATLSSTNKIALFLGDPDPVIDKTQWIQNDILLYMALNGKDTRDDNPRSMPQSYYPKPTTEDYNLGTFTRYIIVKVNELHYIEVNKDTYDKLKGESSTIVWELYTCFKLQWTLTGIEEEVFDINRSQVLIVGNKIQRQGLPEFLRNDYLKFYISENINNQYTSGDDYTLPNGLNYEGLYHIMPGGVAMTGRFHGEGEDILLTSISN